MPPGEVYKRGSEVGLSNSWPCDKDPTILKKKLLSLFIFVSALARFIEPEYYEPNEWPSSSLPYRTTLPMKQEGRVGIYLPYTWALTCAFSEVRGATVFVNSKRVLGAVVREFNPLSRM